ncbi:hypothetical protein GCM10022237_08100 [Nocardioides ginsengisoli]|uniref:Pvc16 family protein n=1 Tax=Nocardioides ginsengisoli TaxID=363868 RepID=A0ABW3VZA6_9ACTN
MAIAATALSLREHLQRWFTTLAASDPSAFRALPTVKIVRTDDFSNFGNAAGSLIKFPSLTLFCYRVDVNRAMRSPWAAVGSVDGSAHLPVDIHFLLTPFDSDADAELRILGAAMQCLEATPILTGPRLHPLGGWDARDGIQLINEDLITEDVMSTFETLPTDFRLSVSYVARIARIDAPVEPDNPDVLTAISGLAPTLTP